MTDKGELFFSTRVLDKSALSSCGPQAGPLGTLSFAFLVRNENNKNNCDADLEGIDE